jgi:hypothetical protein
MLFDAGADEDDVQRHQRRDHDEERQCVQQKGRIHRLRLAVPPARERVENQREDRRSQHAGDVELNRIEGDGVRQILLVDERRHERLIRRSAEGLRQPGDEGERQDVPDLDDAEIHERGQGGRGRHLHVLRRQQRPASVAAVGQHAADERGRMIGSC